MIASSVFLQFFGYFSGTLHGAPSEIFLGFFLACFQGWVFSASLNGEVRDHVQTAADFSGFHLCRTKVAREVDDSKL